MEATGSHEHDRTAGWQLEAVMEIATRLAGHEGIGAIHVVVGERPAYDALLRCRELAEANDLTLTLTADTIVLRPPRPPLLEGLGATSTQAPGRGSIGQGRSPAEPGAGFAITPDSEARSAGLRDSTTTPRV